MMHTRFHQREHSFGTHVQVFFTGSEAELQAVLSWCQSALGEHTWDYQAYTVAGTGYLQVDTTHRPSAMLLKLTYG